ncbi:hypothetical protein ASPZODRAFT_131150 [Penicilliopsis zonata CBS 506.65]|uniref:DUF7703 domain-containing protein n=1 Tax=Penicilliopsis zonata CBS 506.65 TaxID=1073090 RepID=A0A1L9SKI6_9EURO|nr:hypothetical protein ASPZODRAFT_131150 [Penicilliopsis zonata CBS 506.65]OJJ47606.1 hypothetical protein ASPZODRAFT_131150 [Penicilliopsis zonata CBS 506.65]
MVYESSLGNGVSGDYRGHSLGVRITIATLAAISWYNAVELVILVFVTFHRFRGLYFWSLLVSSAVGLVWYSLGFLLKFFGLVSVQAAWLPVTMLTIGWWCMVTGQSVVLYSRLHLVMRNPPVLRWVLRMIVVDAVLLHLPTTVLTYGANLHPANYAFVYGYSVMEKIQMTGFFLQETILSSLYIWETVRLLRMDPSREKRRIMYELIVINAVIILMDVVLLILEYMNNYIMETILKGTIYSIKLKLEFAVLGKLVRLVGRQQQQQAPSVVLPVSLPPAPTNFPDFVDSSRFTSDVTHAASPATLSSSSRRTNHPWMDADAVSIAMFEHSPSVRETRRSDLSVSWSGETKTSPVDFTERTKYSYSHDVER